MSATRPSRARGGSARAEGGPRTPAARLPVARVAVDIPLPHLDRPFDYLVDAGQGDAAVPGCRVRVRFAGQLVNGYLLERVEHSEHAKLAFLDRVVSAEPVLSPEVARLARAVADRWAGTMADVLRLAVPPRHAAAEATVPAAAPEPPGTGVPVPGSGSWQRYVDGPARLDRIGTGGVVRAVLTALPGDWPATVADAVGAALDAGRGAVVVVPDHRDVAVVDEALRVRLGSGRHVALSADLGPAERYRRFLAVSRGVVRAAVGTRAAVWAPVHDLGLVAVWDDGDDLHAEPRAPYAHARDVAILRAHLADASLLLAGHAVSAEAASLAESGWAAAVEPTAAGRADRLPAVATASDEAPDDPLVRAARLPTLAWRTARDALAAGAPVLVQVPRRGYQPALACARCRTPARCAACAGPLGRTGGDDDLPRCRWCGAVATGWCCPACGADALRASVVGARRTAEELGRAFPGVPVRTSGGDAVLARVPDRAALVVATPGAEPVADGGYGAALLLDGWALLSRPDLRAGEEALRRWLNAAALVRPAPAGRVVVAAPTELRPVQALLRWSPRWHADRELADRVALHLPPGGRMAALTGAPTAIEELLALAELPAGAELLGPVPVPVRSGGRRGPASPDGGGADERMLVRVPRRAGGELAVALKQAAGVRSARKSPDPVRVELDPADLL